MRLHNFQMSDNWRWFTSRAVWTISRDAKTTHKRGVKDRRWSPEVWLQYHLHMHAFKAQNMLWEGSGFAEVILPSLNSVRLLVVMLICGWVVFLLSDVFKERFHEIYFRKRKIQNLNHNTQVRLLVVTVTFDLSFRNQNLNPNTRLLY